MSASECTQCQHRNAPNVGIRMDHDGIRLDNQNELRCRNRNGPTVSIRMLDNWNEHVRSEDCMSEQLAAKKNNLWQKTSRQVRTVLRSGWNTLSEYFSS